ncbi:MAG TPA: ABC transporter, partial [Brevundimonas sp.]|nr:ABC transporter [Brevundimonas sp.]
TMVYVTHDQIEAMTLADRIVVLNGGVIEQVGAPMDLYEHPCNRFVAEFIGSPKMNMISVTLVEAGPKGAVLKTAGGDTLRAAVKAEGAKPGDTLTLGIRPEHLSLDGPGEAIHGRADFVETLGNATYAYIDIGEGHDSMTAQLAGSARPKSGDRLELKLQAEHAYLFDADGKAFQRL